jgi:hypothetical protein
MVCHLARSGRCRNHTVDQILSLHDLPSFNGADEALGLIANTSARISRLRYWCDNRCFAAG